MAPTDDAEKINSKLHGPHVFKQHLRSTKKENLIESIGVVSAKCPPKVKLELFTTLECQNWGELYVPWLRGYWGFYSSRELISFPWFRSLFLIRILMNVFYRTLSL